jgi:hypothetical protein
VTLVRITSHRGLSPPTTRVLKHALQKALADYGESVTGVTALADDTDQLFACAGVDQGGLIEVIVPAAQYRDGLPTEFTQNRTICSATPSRCTGSTSPSRRLNRTWSPAN